MELLKRMKIHTQDGRTYRISLYWRGGSYLVQYDQPWTEWDYPWENNNGWRMIMMLSEPGLHVDAAIRNRKRKSIAFLSRVSERIKQNTERRRLFLRRKDERQ